jgi:hypothetical protein
VKFHAFSKFSYPSVVLLFPLALSFSHICVLYRLYLAKILSTSETRAKLSLILNWPPFYSRSVFLFFSSNLCSLISSLSLSLCLGIGDKEKL